MRDKKGGETMSPVGRPKADNPKSNRFSIRLDNITEKKIGRIL